MGSPNRILSAAENIFGRFGYRRASMSEIAQEAGLTRQALYHHYPGKEALFRAVVEQLHELAYEAEAAAGLDRERAGGGLADILAGQIGARFRYLLECVEESPQADELLSEHQLQTRDLYQSFIEHNADLRAETIERVCARQGACLTERHDVARARPMHSDCHPRLQRDSPECLEFTRTRPGDPTSRGRRRCARHIETPH
jgi:AcrR family transcriptional regulator